MAKKQKRGGPKVVSSFVKKSMNLNPRIVFANTFDVKIFSTKYHSKMYYLAPKIYSSSNYLTKTLNLRVWKY
jgi:hypothetical protein